MTDSRAVLDSIRRIVRALRLASRRAETRFGLSSAQLFVLKSLQGGGPRTINEIAERTFTHQSSVSTVVSRLQRSGLLERARSKADGRRREVTLTPEGRSLLRTRVELGQTRLLAGVEGLAPRERAQLAELLAKVVRQAGFSDVPARMFFEEAP